MSDFIAWSAPDIVDSLEKDYTAVRAGVALLDFTFLSLFAVDGPDAATFLQGMVSNDVKRLGAGEGCLAVVLSPVGKMIADLIVLKHSEESFWVICRSERKERVMSALGRFIVADQVELKDISDRTAVGVMGPFASARLAGILEIRPEKPFSHLPASVAGKTVQVVRDTRFGVDGYQVWLPLDFQAQCVEWMQKRCELPIAGRQAFEVLRIEAGVPVYGIDYDESNLPLESNLDHAVSFTKGCYTGQEVIARVTNLGHVSKKLMGLVVEGDTIPQPGEEILVQNQSGGHVTSAARSLKLGRPVALAYIQKQWLAPGTEIELKSSARKASVQPLPLIPPEL